MSVPFTEEELAFLREGSGLNPLYFYGDSLDILRIRYGVSQDKGPCYLVEDWSGIIAWVPADRADLLLRIIQYEANGSSSFRRLIKGETAEEYHDRIIREAAQKALLRSARPAETIALDDLGL